MVMLKRLGKESSLMALALGHQQASQEGGDCLLHRDQGKEQLKIMAAYS